MHRIVPVSVKLMGLDVETRHLLLGDLDALLVVSEVKIGVDAQTVRGCCVRYEINNDIQVREWSAPPVSRDVAEQAVLNLVPLAGSRWKVVDMNHQASFVCEIL